MSLVLFNIAWTKEEATFSTRVKEKTIENQIKLWLCHYHESGMHHSFILPLQKNKDRVTFACEVYTY